MAKRRSILSRVLQDRIHDMVLRTKALQFSECGIDPNVLVASIITPVKAADAFARKTIPVDVLAQCPEENTERVNVAIPIPDTLVSTRTMRHTSTVLHAGGMGNRDLPTWKAYREALTGDPEQEREATAAVVFEVDLPHRIPLQYFYTTDYMNNISAPKDAILLNPDRLGDHYDDYLEAARKLYNLNLLLEYMGSFAGAVATHCSTPGIVKRLWPEAVNFVGPALAEEIKQAKESGWPTEMRQRLTDLTTPEGRQGFEEISSTAMAKQLRAITDAILQSTLMPDPDTYYTAEDRQAGATIDEWYAAGITRHYIESQK